MLLRQWKGRIAKLVSSTTELWTPAPDLAWRLKYLHTQQKEAWDFSAHSPLGYAFLSISIQGVQRIKPAS